MKENDIAEDFWEITLKEQRETGMNKKGDKLNHLKSCQVSFPPEIFLNSRPHGRHKVVEIHDDVDSHIEEPTECRVTSTNESDSKPRSKRHDTMMDNMKGGQVGELLAEQEQERVKEVNKLREVIPPGHISCIEPIRSIAIVHWLT